MTIEEALVQLDPSYAVGHIMRLVYTYDKSTTGTSLDYLREARALIDLIIGRELDKARAAADDPTDRPKPFSMTDIVKAIKPLEFDD